MLVLEIKDPGLVKPLLKTGGIVESLPAVVYLIAAALSAFLTIKLILRAKRFVFWGLYSIFCFFLAGEEAKWGRESVLGWHILSPTDSKQVGDIHNLFTHNFLAGVSFSSISYLAFVAIALGAIFWGCRFLTFKQLEGWLKWFKRRELSQQFVMAGLVLLLFGLVDILNESLGLSYIRGQWSLEECFELFASIALLFAVIVRNLDPSLNKVSRRKL